MAKKINSEKTTKKLIKKEYTNEEKIRIANLEERNKRKPVKFDAVLDNSNEPKIRLDSKDPLREVKMLEAFGTPDSDLQSHLLSQAIQTFGNTIPMDEFNTDGVALAGNNSLATLAGIQPQDEIEAMLAIQMMGVHNMAMNCIDKATRTERVNFMGAYLRGATKLLRIFVAQIEALKKYRNGSQQKMIVEHIHINEGGQAIVGNVNQGGGKKNNE